MTPFGCWLDAVARDPGLSAAGFRVAFAVARLADGDGCARARVLEVAAAAGVSSGTCRDAIFRLAERGHVEVKLDRASAKIVLAARPPKRRLSPRTPEISL
jgi:hypothetical protein